MSKKRKKKSREQLDFLVEAWAVCHFIKYVKDHPKLLDEIYEQMESS